MAAGADRILCSALGRTALLLFVLLSLHAQAGAAPAAGFDQVIAARVYAAALSFMAPRILDAVPVPQLTEWGLRGITALDPTLTPVIQGDVVTLVGSDGPVASLALPAGDDVAGWGKLAAAVGGAAYDRSDALRRAGTTGMIASFFDEMFNHLDPYSRYAAPDVAAADRDRRQGAAGIGVSLGGRPGSLAITAVVADSPAAAAGVRVGDRLVGIDGAPLPHAGVEAALAALGGADGSAVSLLVRDRDGRQHAVALHRALIPADTVTAAREGDLLVLGVSGFTASTAARLAQELDAGLDRQPQPHGIVVDLRGNRGGLLNEAVETADLMLANGLIAVTQGRAAAANHVWRAEGTDAADGLPIVVIVDGRSASAAEVLAAALSDDGRAVVVGSTTLGKGLVQTVDPLPDGGELFVTWSRVLAPAGWPLQGLGVMPQVCTSLGEEQTRAQLDALNGGTQGFSRILATHRAARPGLPLAEMLTIRDACPAALGRDADMDAARFLIANPVAYASALEPL